jgi:murein DD-endopeptidase MepM/ murein hydrolase activator NlpD
MDSTTKFYERIEALQPTIASVGPFKAETDKLVKKDFTEINDVWKEAINTNVDLFSTTVHSILQTAEARYGIGGYLENRHIYARSRVFDGTEPRRTHLGIDIWGKEDTPVMAPIDATVHSFAFNNAYGDYGATIILQHSLGEFTFYSLCGNLALKSLQTLEEGMPIKAGTTFAWLGKPEENGYWPPHLYFQLMLQMEVYRGVYPGVCAASQLMHYAQNCPNPDIILQMEQFAVLAN